MTTLTTQVNFQDKIKDRIKEEFVNLIDDEMWESLVKGVVDDFTKSKHNTIPSEFSVLVKDVLQTEVNKRVVQEVGKLVESMDIKSVVVKYFEENAQAIVMRSLSDLVTKFVERAISFTPTPVPCPECQKTVHVTMAGGTCGCCGFWVSPQ